MVSLTLSIPDDLKKEMEEFPEINWSEIARAAIKSRIEMLKKFKAFSKESELSKEESIKIGRMINKSVSRKHLNGASR
jgi:hypothetical protein